MFNNKMIANSVEGIFVKAGRVGLFKTLIEFEIKNLETQGLGGANVVGIPRQPRSVIRRRTDNQTDGFKDRLHGVIGYK